MSELHYYKLLDSKTHEVLVGIGDDVDFFTSLGYTSYGEVEKAYNNKWYLKGYVPEETADEIAIREAKARIIDAEENLRLTDYIGIKIAEGAATREEYAEQLAQRQAWRDEINACNATLARFI